MKRKSGLVRSLARMLAFAGLFSVDARAAEVTLEVTGDWLQVPVYNPGVRCKVNVFDGERNLFSFSVNECGTNAPTWYFPIHVADCRGKRLRFVHVPPAPRKGAREQRVPFELFRFTSTAERPANQYDEPARPQFHFSPVVGWNNDPNGLTYYKGQWHLFYQGAPCARDHRQNFWGHAVSDDLVRWTETDPGVWPDNEGFIASGSGVVDVENTAGFGPGAHVLVYTRMPWVGCREWKTTQDLAYSTDGVHYTKFAGNPVLREVTPHNRDPKVFWHAPTKRWVMFVYVGNYGEGGEKRHTFHIYNSPDLKRWELTSVLKGDRMCDGKYFYECPDCVELPIEGETGRKWVVWGAGGMYAVGDFDGKAFTPDESRINPTWCGYPNFWRDRDYYAAQTFFGSPDGRTIWMPWFRLRTPDDHLFNQGMGLPCELGLKRTAEGLRLAWKPVRELESLRTGPAQPFAAFDGELVEAFVEADAGESGEVRLNLRGAEIVWNRKAGTLTFAHRALVRAVPWKTAGGRLSLRVFVDRQGIEIFSTDGLNLLPVQAFRPDRSNGRLYAAVSGDARLLKAEAYALRSVWRRSVPGADPVP